jgi:hypothetical protein
VTGSLLAGDLPAEGKHSQSIDLRTFECRKHAEKGSGVLFNAAQFTGLVVRRGLFLYYTVLLRHVYGGVQGEAVNSRKRAAMGIGRYGFE